MNWRDSIWVQTRSRSGRSRRVQRSVELPMKENKPVVISGNPSKPPNDNIKTKLKNNSTPTTQVACGRASTTSQVLKGNKPATVNIAAYLPDDA